MSRRNPQVISDESRRGYVRPSKGFPRQRQIDALIAEGCGVIYIDGEHTGRDPDDGPIYYEAHDAWHEWLRSLKRGDLAIVSTIGRAGSTRGLIGEAITAIHKAGAVMVEASTGRRSDDVSVLHEMVLDGVDELKRVHRYTSETAKAARAKQIAEKPRRDRIAIRKAMAIWKDTKHYPTVRDAIAAMDGWDVRAAYRELRSRHGGDPSRGGRPRKPKA